MHLFENLSQTLSAALRLIVVMVSCLVLTVPALAQLGGPPNFSPAVLSIVNAPVCLEGSGADQQLVLADCAIPSGSTQLLNFEEVSVGGQNKWYRLKFGSNNDCVGVSGASTANDAQIQRQGCKSQDHGNQLWQFSKAGSSTNVLLINRHSGKCIDQKNQRAGTGLVQRACKQSPDWRSQVFTVNHPAK